MIICFFLLLLLHTCEVREKRNEDVGKLEINRKRRRCQAKASLKLRRSCLCIDLFRFFYYSSSACFSYIMWVTQRTPTFGNFLNSAAFRRCNAYGYQAQATEVLITFSNKLEAFCSLEGFAQIQIDSRSRCLLNENSFEHLFFRNLMKPDGWLEAIERVSQRINDNFFTLEIIPLCGWRFGKNLSHQARDEPSDRKKK